MQKKPTAIHQDSVCLTLAEYNRCKNNNDVILSVTLKNGRVKKFAGDELRKMVIEGRLKRLEDVEGKPEVVIVTLT